MSEDDEQSTVEGRLLEATRARSRHVPAGVHARLADMRRSVVAEFDERGERGVSLSGIPVFASLAGVALVVAVAIGVTFQGAGTAEIPLVSEPEIAVVQDMELLEELEFLAWLEEELQGAG